MLAPADRLEIDETLSLQAHLFDTNELDRLGEIFTPDAVYDLTAAGIGAVAGIDAIRSAATQLATSGRAPLAHFVTNIVVTSDGDDAATARSKGLVIHADGTIEGVTHDDTLRRDHGSWRISRRTITPVRPVASSGNAR